jgi:hypothetical protein
MNVSRRQIVYALFMNFLTRSLCVFRCDGGSITKKNGESCDLFLEPIRTTSLSERAGLGSGGCELENHESRGA